MHSFAKSGPINGDLVSLYLGPYHNCTYRCDYWLGCRSGPSKRDCGPKQENDSCGVSLSCEPLPQLRDRLHLQKLLLGKQPRVPDPTASCPLLLLDAQHASNSNLDDLRADLVWCRLQTIQNARRQYYLASFIMSYYCIRLEMAMCFHRIC